MKVKIIIGIAGSNFCHAPGEEPDIPDKEAKRWIDAGIAEKVAPKKKAAAKPAPAAAAKPADPPKTTPAPKKKATGKKGKK